MTSEVSKSVGKKLKKYRLEQGYTQLSLAKKAGLNSNYYARVERGDIRMSVDVLVKVNKVLKVDYRDLLP